MWWVKALRLSCKFIQFLQSLWCQPQLLWNLGWSLSALEAHFEEQIFFQGCWLTYNLAHLISHCFRIQKRKKQGLWKFSLILFSKDKAVVEGDSVFCSQQKATFKNGSKSVLRSKLLLKIYLNDFIFFFFSGESCC